MHELNTSDIEKQEVMVRQLTHERLGGFCNYFNRAIDLLIRLYYRIPHASKIKETPDYNYISHISHWFYMSIFTFKACLLLLESGYYLETNILCRNLIEVLVKMRYFENHKDQLLNFEEPHINPNKSPSVKFRTMFDEILPGYYDIEYRWMLSHMSHGGIGATLFKIDWKSSSDKKADNGVVFKEKRASILMNNLTNFIFGYIRFYKHRYPLIIKNLETIDALKELREVEQTLEDVFNQHVALKGGENEWHKVSRLIWDFR